MKPTKALCVIMLFCTARFGESKSLTKNFQFEKRMTNLADAATKVAVELENKLEEVTESADSQIAGTKSKSQHLLIYGVNRDRKVILFTKHLQN